MLNFNFFVILLCLASISVGNFSYSIQQEQEKKTIKRVKRPDLSGSDRNGIYFKDVFAEGLVGQAPEVGSPNRAASAAKQGQSTMVAGGTSWSRFVSRDAIEDEIKLIYRKMQGSITTPSAFNSKFREVRQQLEMLSMLFAIIHEYDKDIRWKKFGGTLQVAAAKTATKARTPSRPSFQAAKLAREDLGELVRGGSIAIEEDIPAELDWYSVIQRRPLMVQLELALGEVLKPGVSNKDEFDKNKNDVLRTGNLVSAMANVLIQDGMDEADDDGYVDFAKNMGAASRQLILAIESDEFETAALAVNKIEQSCIACHAEWR